MLALLAHGIIPHHHHNAEAEKCNLEEHYAALHHAEKSITYISSEVCCDDQHSNEKQPHACNLNVAASKQISVILVAIFSSISFHKKVSQPEELFLQYSEQLIPSTSPEVQSLRAPPLS